MEKETLRIVYNKKGCKELGGIESTTIQNVIHIESTEFLTYFVTVRENPKRIDTKDIRTEYIGRVELVL